MIYLKSRVDNSYYNKCLCGCPTVLDKPAAFKSKKEASNFIALRSKSDPTLMDYEVVDENLGDKAGYADIGSI